MIFTDSSILKTTVWFQLKWEFSHWPKCSRYPQVSSRKRGRCLAHQTAKFSQEVATALTRKMGVLCFISPRSSPYLSAVLCPKNWCPEGPSAPPQSWPSNSWNALLWGWCWTVGRINLTVLAVQIPCTISASVQTHWPRLSEPSLLSQRHMRNQWAAQEAAPLFITTPTPCTHTKIHCQVDYSRIMPVIIINKQLTLHSHKGQNGNSI